MCNPYSITKNQATIRDLFRVTSDSAGNMPPLPGIFPDYPPAVDRALALVRSPTVGECNFRASLTNRL